MSYLRTFFNEKNLPSRTFDITAEDGTFHMVDSEVVIETILMAPRSEQIEIGNVIRKIDFANGDVHHFLEHLASALVASYVSS